MAPNGARRIFPTISDLADILGDTDFDFEIFFVWIPNFQVPDFQISRNLAGPSLGPAWARLGPRLGPNLGLGLSPRVGRGGPSGGPAPRVGPTITGLGQTLDALS